MSLYEDLGVSEDASEQEIKKAYKRRAAKAHPDKGGTDEEFRKVSHAYAILRDPQRKLAYDETGDEGREGGLTKLEEATVMVGQNLINIMEVNNYARKNYFTEIRQVMASKSLQFQRNISELEVQIRKLTYMMENTKADVIIINCMRSKLANYNQQIEQQKQSSEMLGLCLQVIDECEYLGEIPKPHNMPSDDRMADWVNSNESDFGRYW